MTMRALDVPLSLRLPKAAARRLADAGFNTVEDLLTYAPKRYYQWGELTDIGSLTVGDDVTLLADVLSQNLIKNRSGNGYRLVVRIGDGLRNLTCTFFAKNPYMLTHHQRLLKPGATVLVAGKVSEYRGQLQLVQPEFEEVEAGSAQDVARRAGRPIPIYRSIAGLPSWKIGSLIHLLLDQMKDEDFPDVLDADVRQSHALFDRATALRMLHEPHAPVDWQTARRTLAWEEALVLQTALLAARARGEQKAPVLAGTVSDGAASQVSQLEENLPFTLTEAQREAWRQIRSELASSTAMQRLLQADVGAGKTVVALLAMLQAQEAGYQAVLLAPTEVLARQHYASLAKLLDGAGVMVPLYLLTSKRSSAEKEQVLANLAIGEPCLVVGTHALIQEGVDIPKLGLLVVDEQHRFGVAQREHLRQGRELIPHLLVMTATPIPRTIAMTVFGDLDVIAMRGLPPGRTPVKTYLVDERNRVWMDRLWQRVREEVDGGGRVYVVCPRIDPGNEEPGSNDAPPSGQGTGERDRQGEPTIPSALEVQESLQHNPALEGIEIGLAHGRRSPAENAEAFAHFADGSVPVLVATTVVEVGVDVPEATMMVVLGGNRFGLSQLHQLRGRVGRSERPSVAMITHPGDLAPETKERLDVIASTTDGFELAEADLRLRKEGDVLGKNQSGATSSLRFLSTRSDAATISGARELAQDILSEDPTLEHHGILAQAVLSRAGEELVWLERN